MRARDKGADGEATEGCLIGGNRDAKSFEQVLHTAVGGFGRRVKPNPAIDRKINTDLPERRYPIEILPPMRSTIAGMEPLYPM